MTDPLNLTIDQLLGRRSQAVIWLEEYALRREITDWLRSLDIRAGDTIEFGEKAERPVEAAPKLEAVS